MTATTTGVHLDSTQENVTPDLALRADRVLNERWNGVLRPLASAGAFGAFLDAWRASDPNGIWGHVSEVGDTLVYLDSDADEPETFPKAGERADGTSLYDLSGWVWVSGPSS